MTERRIQIAAMAEAEYDRAHRVTSDRDDGNPRMRDESEGQETRGLEILEHTNTDQRTTITCVNGSGTT